METITRPVAPGDDHREQFVLEDNSRAMALFGEAGSNLRIISRMTGVRVDARGGLLTLRGPLERTRQVKRLILELYDLLGRGYTLAPHDMEYAVRMTLAGSDVSIGDVFLDTALITFRKKVVSAKSPAQKLYIDAIRRSDMVFAIGPAGTGKTYLAMAMAVGALVNKEVERIVLTRPAVEAGERLGFLPGDLAAKVDPYLRPLFDALHDFLDFERAEKLMDRVS